jgi:hypothetical protein
MMSVQFAIMNFEELLILELAEPLRGKHSNSGGASAMSMDLTELGQTQAT